MSAGLVSIRMLYIAAAHRDHDLWRRAAGQASIPVEFNAVESSAGPKQITHGGIDICIADAGLPDAELRKIIAAARAVKPQPLVILAAPRGAPAVEGADGVFTRPSNPDDARKLIELCVRMKVPTRVLIVDDSGTMRGIVRKILSGSRFALDIREAGEGLAALKELRGGRFGMVFLDYNMPGLNGIETLLEIKRASPQLAVVMMTSTPDKTLIERARKAGALAFLKKPFFPSDIDAVLQRHFGLQAAGAQT
jgi:CheY-like chemotaxis protein